MVRNIPSPRAARPGAILIALVVGGALIYDAGLAAPFGWRGDGSGSFANTAPPLHWGADSNVAWATPLPDWSNASPALAKDRLFVCIEPASLACLATEDGALLWTRSNDLIDLLELDDAQKEEARESVTRADTMQGQIAGLNQEVRRMKRQVEKKPDDEELKERIAAKEKEIGALEAEMAQIPWIDQLRKPTAHEVNGYSSPTPVTDGRRVWVAFGTGVVACYNADGSLVWRKRMEVPDHDWGGSTSPLLAGEIVVVRFKDYVGLDAATGEERWRVPTQVTFGTSAVATLHGTPLLITPRGEVIRVQDGSVVATGLFGIKENQWRALNTPLIEGSTIYATYGAEGELGEAIAVELDEKFEPREVWRTQIPKDRYYASPVLVNGLIFAFSRAFELLILEADTGAIVKQEKMTGLSGTAFPSPFVAGDRVYLSDDNGTTVVLEPSAEAPELARNRFEPFRSTPVVRGDTLFVRTLGRMVALRAK